MSIFCHHSSPSDIQTHSLTYIPTKVRHFSRVRLFVTLQTIAHQTPLSMGFSRQEYWSGLPCPFPGDLPNPRTEPASLVSPVLTSGFFITSATWEALSQRSVIFKFFSIFEWLTIFFWMSENFKFTLLIVGLFYSCKCGVSFYFWHEFCLKLVESLWGLLFFSLCCCSVTQLCLTLDDPMGCSTPGIPALHCLLELAQTHVHWVGDAIQPSHLSSPSSPTVNLSQLQGLFQWVNSLYQVAKVLELKLQHQSLHFPSFLEFELPFDYINYLYTYGHVKCFYFHAIFVTYFYRIWIWIIVRTLCLNSV